jgi:hypothetical protein
MVGTEMRAIVFYNRLEICFRVFVTRLVASNMLNGSLAKLLFSLSTWSILAPRSRLMFLIGKVISSMVIVLLLKCRTIPNSIMVSEPRMRSFCGLAILNYIGF